MGANSSAPRPTQCFPTEWLSDATHAAEAMEAIGALTSPGGVEAISLAIFERRAAESRAEVTRRTHLLMLVCALTRD